ncbi:Ger(x)C family spore germination protein [Edaphobacillus lindanitolerans]|uniref:Germination protein, Ger(X)C family n=1 Tax=Edaphobacillus lindanitolerans TaxID=550447 RepID=A0A1U7PPJ7_9BACI|nr:Ger(x)C family spore germination protein [Edaphobacillus lindanitolerans]SIT80707.1 germination protein, Ger(x)C family [Edaphobacillus lindanitolerans]
MKKKVLLILLLLPLLSGCWDELYFKDLQIVTLVGIGGEKGDVTVHYSFPSVSGGNGVEYLTAKASGSSFSDARNNMNLKTGKVLDISQLQVLLLSDKSAEANIFDYLDSLYRTPRNRLSSHVALVKGELDAYMGNGKNENSGKTQDTPEFLTQLMDTIKEYSLSTDYNVQDMGSIMFAQGQDLALPLLKMSEESGQPELDGTALFNDFTYTGKSLDITESKMLNILQHNTGKFLRDTYIFEVQGREVPVTYEFIRSRKNWDIGETSITIRETIHVEIDEYSVTPVIGKGEFAELEKKLSAAIENDMQKTVESMQEAKSDAIGIGRRVRAFHHNLWEKGDWHDTFSELDIQVKVKVKVERTGILD